MQAGFEHSWALGTVEGYVQTNSATIKFESFETSDGVPLVQVCPLRCVRPRVKSERLTCARVGQEVDILADDVWWEGVWWVTDAKADVRIYCNGVLFRQVSLERLRQGVVYDAVWHTRESMDDTS